MFNVLFSVQNSLTSALPTAALAFGFKAAHKAAKVATPFVKRVVLATGEAVEGAKHSWKETSVN